MTSKKEIMRRLTHFSRRRIIFFLVAMPASFDGRGRPGGDLPAEKPFGWRTVPDARSIGAAYAERRY